MSPYRNAGYVNLSVRAQLTMSNVNNNCKTDNDSIAKNVKKKIPLREFPLSCKEVPETFRAARFATGK